MYRIATRTALAFGLVVACTDARSGKAHDSAVSVDSSPRLSAAIGASTGMAAPLTALTFDTTRWTADAEARAIAASAGRVSRNGSLLEIRLPSGSSLTLRNATGTVGAKRYVYLGRLDTLGYRVIGVALEQLPETRMLLVSEQTGDTTAVTGVPIVSPNRERFLVIPDDPGVDNSVEVWSLASGAPRFEWGTGDEDMRPIDGAWKDDSTVTYRVVPARSQSKPDTISMLLPFRDGGWKIATRM